MFFKGIFLFVSSVIASFLIISLLTVFSVIFFMSTDFLLSLIYCLFLLMLLIEHAHTRVLFTTSEGFAYCYSLSALKHWCLPMGQYLPSLPVLHHAISIPCWILHLFTYREGTHEDSSLFWHLSNGTNFH